MTKRYLGKIFVMFPAGCLALCLAAHGQPADAAKLYKWTDKNGEVHYGDKVPPEVANRERKVLSEQGVVMKTLKRAKTDDEVAQEKEAARLAEAEALRQSEIRAHDHMLLATFSSADDMILTRDGKLASIDATIRITQDRIERIEQQIQTLSRNAADIERSARAVPENLHANIETLRAQANHYREYIGAQENEKKAIQKQFDVDLKRFQYLQSRRQTSLPRR